MVGKHYKHTNGNIYTVLLLTNTEALPEQKDSHPVDVIYMGQNGKLWSKRLSEWDKSFNLIK